MISIFAILLSGTKVETIERIDLNINVLIDANKKKVNVKNNNSTWSNTWIISLFALLSQAKLFKELTWKFIHLRLATRKSALKRFMIQSQIKNSRITASVLPKIGRNRPAPAWQKLQLGGCSWKYCSSKGFRRSKGTGAIRFFWGSGRSKTRQTTIIRSPDCSDREVAIRCFSISKKMSDFNGDRVDTVLAPSCVVPLKVPDGPCFAGRCPAGLHALDFVFVKF